MTNDKLTNLLLVDDDDVDVMIVQRAFEKNNITDRLYVAANGVEALFMLRDGGKPPLIPPNRRLILLDLNMPKMGGIEFLRELRADPELRTIPVIVLTTSNEQKDKLEAYNLNVAGYIVKPVTFTKFVEVMATVNKYWTLNEIP
ncbi:response regulator [Argonema galeatum]|uniref:response regulator n=1 Tax=Argonema galeatum TaxID=2942762 RepID=UPI0020113D3F|nr:response regulator [Argonema galeatum]MCL1464220.1 response regulator [Argonema galeatum A003/A1]